MPCDISLALMHSPVLNHLPLLPGFYCQLTWCQDHIFSCWLSSTHKILSSLQHLHLWPISEADLCLCPEAEVLLTPWVNTCSLFIVPNSSQSWNALIVILLLSVWLAVIFLPGCPLSGEERTKTMSILENKLWPKLGLAPYVVIMQAVQLLNTFPDFGPWWLALSQTVPKHNFGADTA